MPLSLWAIEKPSQLQHGIKASAAAVVGATVFGRKMQHFKNITLEKN